VSVPLDQLIRWHWWAAVATVCRLTGDLGAAEDASPRDADTLSLMFLCCHPALDASARVALTLRSVCGLSTAQITAAFPVPEATMAKRLVRAKAKIRDAHIPSTDDAGELVLLEDQDRGRWDRAMIAEGESVLEAALRRGRPGPYQLHAAIAACHSTAASADGTDWRQIALLYAELIR